MPPARPPTLPRRWPQQVGALPAYNFIRKAASDFGWDWGPAFAPAGINGRVLLRGRSTAVLAGAGAAACLSVPQWQQWPRRALAL